ncbi:MAG: CheY-like chemotaxis protein [Cognaticolwellia sp.]
MALLRVNVSAFRQTLLIVDDDPDDQELLREALDEAGFDGSVHTAGDGDTALAWLRVQETRPDLMVLDLHMPRVRGFELLAQIRADPKLRPMPVVVMTTSWSQDDVRRAYELGVNSFLIKPVLFEELVHTVESLVYYWFTLNELPPA